MTPTILILLLLLALFMTGLFIWSRGAVFGIVAATVFFMLAYTLLVSGIQEVTGRNITENTSVANYSVITEDFVKEEVTGLHTQLLGVLFGAVGLFTTFFSVQSLRGRK